MYFTVEQKIDAELTLIAHAVYAGDCNNQDLKEECDDINRRYNIINAHNRCKAIYYQQFARK